MGFACASLSVGQEGSIMSLKDSFNQMTASFIDILLLAGIHDVVEPKYFFLIIFPFDIDGCIVSLDKKSAT
jgi:hypothetical protein